jgi:hypothetical protein
MACAKSECSTQHKDSFSRYLSTTSERRFTLLTDLSTRDIVKFAIRVGTLFVTRRLAEGKVSHCELKISGERT